MERVQAALQQMPDTRKINKVSRAKKQSRHKDRKRLNNRAKAAVIYFLNSALYPSTRAVYFGKEIDLKANISPLATMDIDTSYIHDLHYTQE